MDTTVTLTLRTGRRITGTWLASGPKRLVLRVNGAEKTYRRNEIHRIQHTR